MEDLLIDGPVTVAGLGSADERGSGNRRAQGGDDRQTGIQACRAHGTHPNLRFLVLWAFEP